MLVLTNLYDFYLNLEEQFESFFYFSSVFTPSRYSKCLIVHAAARSLNLVTSISAVAFITQEDPAM